jgi:pimeloyl-ACP methyl ester carboxylesterase
MPLFDAARGHRSAMSETARSAYCPPVFSHYRLGPSTGLRMVENTRGYVPQSLRGSARTLAKQRVLGPERPDTRVVPPWVWRPTGWVLPDQILPTVWELVSACQKGVPITAIIESRMPLSGGDLAFTMAGTAPAVLLLVHGLGGSRQTWRHLLPALARTHTVIAPELPGHGESDPPAGDYSLGAHACAMRDLLLALGHRRASLVGHSLGGGVALQTAYQFPERTDRLMLISSGGLGTEVAPMLRAATLPGAETVVAGLSKIPAALTRRVLTVLPPLAASPDASALAGVLRGLASTGNVVPSCGPLTPSSTGAGKPSARLANSACCATSPS